jgi:hypothetical protein
MVLRSGRLLSAANPAAHARPELSVAARPANSFESRWTKTSVVDRQARALVESIATRTRRLEERVSTRDFVTVTRAAGEVTRDHATTRERPASSKFGETWSSSQQPVAPAVSVERITENVMRQLDHQITSWRERMGRA